MINFIFYAMAIPTTAYIAILYNSSSLVGITCLEVIFFFIGIINAVYLKKKVQVQLVVPVTMMDVNKEETVQVMINNKSRVFQLEIKCKILCVNQTTGRKRRIVMKGMANNYGHTIISQKVFYKESGFYTYTLVSARIYDFAGLTYFSIKNKEVLNITVLPQLVEIPIKISEGALHFIGNGHLYDDKKPGDDVTEIFQLRPYQPGDRMQNVLWRMSAKNNELIVRENSRPLGYPVIMYLNFSPDGAKGMKGNSLKKREAFNKIIGSISFSLMNVSCNHCIVAYNKEIQDVSRWMICDEESYYRFLLDLLRIKQEIPLKQEINIKELYRNKYGKEPFLLEMSISNRLSIEVNGQNLAQIDVNNVESQISSMEFVV